MIAATAATAAIVAIVAAVETAAIVEVEIAAAAVAIAAVETVVGVITVEAVITAGEAAIDARHGLRDPPVNVARRLSRAEEAQRPFNLLRWFSILSLVAIVAIIGGATLLMTRHITRNLLLRDAIVSRDFLEGVLAVDIGEEFFRETAERRDMGRLDTFIKHLTSMTGLVAASVYGKDGVTVWSSEAMRQGRTFGGGDQLQRALRGYVVVEWGTEVDADYQRLREEGVDVDRENLVGMYLPIRGADADDVFAVVKVLTTPYALFDSIAEQVWLLQSGAAIGGGVLYLAFFGLIFRADRTLQRQTELLREGEAMSTIGEMSAAVAHSIRNPLAGIRSAAELAREDAEGDIRESLDDIIVETDRLNRWVSDLLMAARADVERREVIDLNELIEETLQTKAAEAAQRKIDVIFEKEPLSQIAGSRALLSHAFFNVIVNAYDAMAEGGKLCVRSEQRGGVIHITVDDDGHGMSEQTEHRAFQAMFTTKPNGTGLGLALTKRIIERHSGRIAIRSRPTGGARVEFSLPVGG